MKFNIVLVFLFLISGAAWGDKAKDAEFTKNLIGQWKIHLQFGHVEIKGVSSYQEDGRMSNVGTLYVDGQQIPIDIKLDWKIENGVLISTVRQTNLPQVQPVGEINRDSIVSLNKVEFRYKDEEGTEAVEYKL